VPKINITFDIDSDGILQVTATEEGSGTTGKIVITNDKGRLSKEQIEEMLAKAEEFKAEDEEKGKVIEAKNLLESYLYNWKNQLSNKEFCANLKPAEVEHLNFVVTDGIKWIEEHPHGTLDEYTEKKKEVEETVKPILSSVYEQDDDSKKQSDNKGPVIDEID
jgi:L1 cell adhesion molecule like protein